MSAEKITWRAWERGCVRKWRRLAARGWVDRRTNRIGRAGVVLVKNQSLLLLLLHATTHFFHHSFCFKRLFSRSRARWPGGSAKETAFAKWTKQGEHTRQCLCRGHSAHASFILNNFSGASWERHAEQPCRLKLRRACIKIICALTFWIYFRTHSRSVNIYSKLTFCNLIIELTTSFLLLISSNLYFFNRKELYWKDTNKKSSQSNMLRTCQIL